MRMPLFLAHGDPVLIFGLLFVFLFFSYGIPAIVWLLTKRKKRTAALFLGIAAMITYTVLFAIGLAPAFDGAFEGGLFSFVIFRAIPLVLSILATKAACSLPKTSASEEAPPK